MSDVQTLSVNPAKATLGSLNFDLAEKILKVQAMTPSIPGVSANVAAKRNYFKSFVNFIFGANGTMNSAVSKKILLSRCISGGGMIAMGILALSVNPTIAIILLSAGGCTLAGFFSRLSNVAILGYFGYLSVMSFMGGDLDAYTSILTLSAIPCTLLGSGRYSLDHLLRGGILRLHKRDRLKRECAMAARRMTYRAYSLES